MFLFLFVKKLAEKVTFDIKLTQKNQMSDGNFLSELVKNYNCNLLTRKKIQQKLELQNFQSVNSICGKRVHH